MRIKKIARGGARVSILKEFRVIREVENLRPGCIFIQIGGNDIDSNLGLEVVRVIISNVGNYIDKVLDLGVRLVIIGEVMQRHSCRAVTLEGYRYIRQRVNRGLIRLARKYKGKVKFASFGDFNNLDYFRQDKIHLNHEGYRIYCGKILGIIRDSKLD